LTDSSRRCSSTLRPALGRALVELVLLGDELLDAVVDPFVCHVTS
jgi:hypothetical protein